MTTVFLDTNTCPDCSSPALSVVRMANRPDPNTTTKRIRPLEVILLCGDCGRDFHARASRWLSA